jgi:hypothetical protein
MSFSGPGVSEEHEGVTADEPLANSTVNGGELDMLNFSVSDGGLETMEPVEVTLHSSVIF